MPISIHGPRVGADSRIPGQSAPAPAISIHGPRVGADDTANSWPDIILDFNPRPPCGGRHLKAGRPLRWNQFQSTAPVWGPTVSALLCTAGTAISIHGPRVGADRFGFIRPALIIYFNPRPPCGGRPQGPGAGANGCGFQSTAPVWGPTPITSYSNRPFPISIHGPRVGADFQLLPAVRQGRNFNPRPPCGGRQVRLVVCKPVFLFQSTAPVWGPTANVDKNAAAFLCICAIFLHF